MDAASPEMLLQIKHPTTLFQASGIIVSHNQAKEC
jgi:hypothetical protein